jgi:hypothetical protein
VTEHQAPQGIQQPDDAENNDQAEELGRGSGAYWPAVWRLDDEPYGHYWRVLYPKTADPDAGAFWLAKLKTAEMCMGLFGERQHARHEWIASGPRRGREEAHATAVVTHHASPVRSQTVKVCLSCLWISADLDAEHG